MLGDLLGGLAVGDVSATVLVGIVVLMILTGRLVTRRQLDDTRTDRDYWRAAHDTQQKIALQQGMTLERLLSLAEASEHALTSIQAGLHRSEDR